MHTSDRICLCYFNSFFFFLSSAMVSMSCCWRFSKKLSFAFRAKNKSLRQPVNVDSLSEAEIIVYRPKTPSVWVQCFSNWGVRVLSEDTSLLLWRQSPKCLCTKLTKKKSSWKNFKEDILYLTEALILKTHFSPAGSWFKWRQRDTKRDTEKK